MNDKLESRPRAEQVSYWLGEICLAIGSGNVRNTVLRMIEYYQREAFERGLKAASKKIGGRS